MITSWSYSKLDDFRRCKFAAYLKHDQKIPEPQRPLRPGQTELANDRGSRYHTNCEDYVTGKVHELLPDIERTFGPQLDLLRVLYAEGMVSVEGEWGVDQGWNPVEWKKAWHRSKLDAMVRWSKTEATVIDYKTGRKFGNEMKHGEQMQVYQLNAFSRFPELEVVHTELWYLDQNDVSAKTFTRSQGLRFKDNFHRQGMAITTATEFPPNPNKFSCKWCEYGPWNGGQCQDGVREGWNGHKVIPLRRAA